jgi:predicted SprT family Zn-dependent metalloprotease
MNITDNTYTSLSTAYTYFNEMLFDNTLPNCLITMQRKKNSKGYFAPSMLENKDNNEEITHEIALNPSTFKHRTTKEILSTLVHEMCHLWQEEHGTPARRGYHNKQWADKMLSVGLIPSDNGEEGGKQTGQSIMHYIDELGKFNLLVDGFLVKNPTAIYQDRSMNEKQKKTAKSKQKTKYTCRVCNLNAWGKPNINIICGDDHIQMISEEPDKSEEEEES